MLVPAIRQVAYLDAETADDLVMQVGAGLVRNKVASGIFEDHLQKTKPEDVLELADWLTNFPDDKARRYMLEQNWDIIGYRSPELAMALTASEDPEVASERRIAEFSRLLCDKPEQFESWIRSLPARNRRIAEDAVK